VDYIVGKNPTNASAAGQLKSLAIVSTFLLLLRNSKARHNNFLRARFLAYYSIFLFLIKRAIILANAFLFLSTFF
jgi:ABC-type multidrug transport system permease subunit